MMDYVCSRICCFSGRLVYEVLFVYFDMKGVLIFVLSFICGVCVSAQSHCGGHDYCIYVSPVGVDSAVGDVQQPVQSLERARQLVREERGVNGYIRNVRVILRGGYYRRKDILLLNSPFDGGQGEYFTSYESYPSELAILTGSHLQVAYPDERGLIVSAGATRQLYFAGRRIPRGRYPAGDRLLRIVSWYGDPGIGRTETKRDNRVLVIEDLGDDVVDILPGSELHIQKEFALDVLRVRTAKRTKAGLLIQFEEPETSNSFGRPYPRKWVGQSVHFEGLDWASGGAWWYRINKEKLVVSGLSNCGIVGECLLSVPVVSTLIGISGTYSRWIENIIIKGLIFEETEWSVPNDGYVPNQANVRGFGASGLVVPPAALEVNYARRIVVQDCVFRRLGAHAIRSDVGLESSTLYNNKFSDSAGGGVYLEGALRSEKGSGGQTRDIAVVGNEFHGLGVVHKDSVALFGGYVNNISTIGNVFYDLPYSAISIGWGWTFDKTDLGNNLVQGNLFMRVLGELSDGGAIYFLSRQDGVVVRDNIIDDMRISPAAPFRFGAGIYLDLGVSGARVDGNKFFRFVAEDGDRFFRVFEQAGSLGNNVIH